jgi:uncharacterized protein YdeI (YjbR/CyaY-like superfamily)
MKFRTSLELHGKTATGIEVPDDIVAALDAGKRPAVRVTVNGHTWRSTVAVMGGRNLVGVSAENRAAAGVSAGDVIDVELVLDTEKREVEVPADLEAALTANPDAAAAFAALSYSNKSRHVLSIEGAKTDETRARRIAKAVSDLGG